MFVLQVRLAKYGFAARYKGPIGTKTIEEKESFTISFDDREFSDSGEVNFLRRRRAITDRPTFFLKFFFSATHHTKTDDN